ncbi:MAG: alpha-amylase family glycosyl hydrolase [Flavobacteriaceae bacterium]
MKNLFRLFLICFLPLPTFGQLSTNPSPFEVEDTVTITVDINSTASNCNGIVAPQAVYMHAGIGTDSSPWGYSVVGNWGQDDGVGEMTSNGNGTYSITITPSIYFGLTAAQITSATKMGIVFRNHNGTQELKANNCNDFIINVGAFQVTMINPTENSNGVVVVANGGGTQILAQNTNGNANYELFANGVSVHTVNNVNFYNGYQFENLQTNQYCELVVTLGSSSVTKSFVIFVDNTVEEAMPSNMEDGINLHPDDNTVATLVLNSPLKDFVYIGANWNSYHPADNDAMKKDPASGKFWITITNLIPGTNYNYQYWVAAISPVANSPKLVKTADPFSTLVLSPFDDPWIPATSYPNLPDYPEDQSREVTVLNTAPESYAWQMTDFVKPKKEDLIIYEVLIRDFDADRSFQNLIDRVDYFSNLNINAIELMPIMEFEGNESWGYNTAFHMAVDKFYGTENKLKELVDVYHQHGIAVILDLALNHAFGRNPMNRMWMDDPDGNGWGDPSSENPYMNEEATHSYSVGADYNHQSALTRYYSERVIKHWIEEFKIDGFRWDLTKGFTQNCTANDQNCTNAYQADRVAVLKHYADYSWSLDPEHYVIFEHLGTDGEEDDWADYRLNEGKGIMLWGKMTDPYNQLTMGYNSNNNINRMGHQSHGFAGKRLIGYAESHDEERLMYKNVTFGNSTSGYNITDLNTALSRMSALGAVSLLVPGPKMIWHFGDLGMDNSINTCADGSVTAGVDCRLVSKPQPQWVEDWLSDAFRSDIYHNWARMNELKINAEVFEGNYEIMSGSLTPKIHIWDTTVPAGQPQDVIVLSNFDLISQNVVPNFPYTGTWYDLMDDSGSQSINVTNTSDPITLEPGEFKIYGNDAVTILSTPVLATKERVTVFPNPAKQELFLNNSAISVKFYNLLGKEVLKYEHIESGQVMDIRSLSNGVYLIKIQTDQGISSRKLLKQ